MRTRLRGAEEVAAVVRRHWIVLGGPWAAALFLFGCLVAAWFLKTPWVVPAAGSLLAASVAWALWRWLDWRCDLWVITSHRVIDESGVLAVRMVDSPLDKINNVTCEQSLWGRLLGIGTLNIQTAAELGSTTIRGVGDPTGIKDLILDLQERFRDRVLARQAGTLLAGAPAATAGGPGTKECPHCAETIKARANVCRFCGHSV
jgi:membrane protein YdbS with pleckstrin-like domain